MSNLAMEMSRPPKLAPLRCAPPLVPSSPPQVLTILGCLVSAAGAAEDPEDRMMNRSLQPRKAIVPSPRRRRLLVMKNSLRVTNGLRGIRLAPLW